MSNLELKGELLEWISEVRDESTLEYLRAIVAKILKKKPTEADWWDKLSPKIQKEIDFLVAEFENNLN
jgi:hypothetical protein